jgi:hypothetical protein
MNLIYPPSTVSGDPTTIYSILPFFWDWPTGSNPSTPFIGSQLEVHLDAKYTNQVAYSTIGSNTSYFSENNVTLLNDIIGDNTYYWRVRPTYGLSGHPLASGAWTGGWSFHRLGFRVQDLQVHVNISTPTFTWAKAEGANSYQIMVSTDPNFGSSVLFQETRMNSYTPPSTLQEDTYYWRVRIIRYGNALRGYLTHTHRTHPQWC